MFVILSNGVKIPSIGLGTSAAHEDQLEKALDTALEVGYRHIDTALVYYNEKVIGRVLQKWFKSGKLKREEVFVTTKLPATGTHQDRVDYFLTKSLSNLQLDYVDLYLIHFPFGCTYEEGQTSFVRDANGTIKMEPKTNHAAIWKKMEEQVSTGRAKSIGLSNYNIRQIETVLKAATIKPACLQVEVHVYLQQRELINFCHKNNITVVAFSPLGAPNHNERMKNFVPTYQGRQLLNMLGDQVINKIGRQYSKSAAQVMLRFLLQLGVVPIPKSTTPQRIRDNFNVFDFALDDDDMATLANLEVGEDARITDFRAFKGFREHPDFPFKSKF